MAESQTVDIDRIANFLGIKPAECKRLAKLNVMKNEGSKFYFLESVQGYIQHQRKQSESETANRTELAEWLSLSSRQVSALRSQGVLVSNTEGVEETQFHLKDSIRAYCEHVRSRQTFIDAKTRNMNLDNDNKAEDLKRKRGETIDRTVVTRDWSAFVAMVIRIHRPFAQKIARRFPKTDKRVIEMIDEELAGIRKQAAAFRFSEADDSAD